MGENLTFEFIGKKKPFLPKFGQKQGVLKRRWGGLVLGGFAKGGAWGQKISFLFAPKNIKKLGKFSSQNYMGRMELGGEVTVILNVKITFFFLLVKTQV